MPDTHLGHVREEETRYRHTCLHCRGSWDSVRFGACWRVWMQERWDWNTDSLSMAGTVVDRRSVIRCTGDEGLCLQNMWLYVSWLSWADCENHMILRRGWFPLFCFVLFFLQPFITTFQWPFNMFWIVSTVDGVCSRISVSASSSQIIHGDLLIMKAWP